MRISMMFKTRENTGSVIVIKQFSAKLQIKLVAELFDSFSYAL